MTLWNGECILCMSHFCSFYAILYFFIYNIPISSWPLLLHHVDGGSTHTHAHFSRCTFMCFTLWSGMDIMHVTLLICSFLCCFVPHILCICVCCCSYHIHIISHPFSHISIYIYHVCHVNIHDIDMYDVIKMMHVSLLYILCHIM